MINDNDKIAYRFINLTLVYTYSTNQYVQIYCRIPECLVYCYGGSFYYIFYVCVVSKVIPRIIYPPIVSFLVIQGLAVCSMRKKHDCSCE